MGENVTRQTRRTVTRQVTPTSPVTASVVTATPFSQTLTALTPVTWTKHSGLDMALFSLAGAVLSMTAKTFAAPTDSDANNVYEVILKATDEFGFFVYHHVRVTVTAT